MKWKDSYDNTGVAYQTDKYGKCYQRGSIVAWASKDKHNHPHLIDGRVLGFTVAPSFIYTHIKTYNNRIVKKLNSELIFIKDITLNEYI